MFLLQMLLVTLRRNYANNAESILVVLFDAYNEPSGFDNVAVKADFEERYYLMNGKPLQEIDEIIYGGYTPYRGHGKAGCVEDVKVGLRLAKVAYIR